MAAALGAATGTGAGTTVLATATGATTGAGSTTTAMAGGGDAASVMGAWNAAASLVNDVSDAARAALAAGRALLAAAALAAGLAADLPAVVLDPFEGLRYSPSLVTVASSSTALPVLDLPRNWGSVQPGGSGHGVRDHCRLQNAVEGRPPHCGCVATHVLVNQADHHENYNRQGQPGEHARVALRPPGRDSARRTEVRPHMEGLRPLRLRGQQRGARVCGLTAGAAFGICCPHGGGRLGGSPVSTRLPSLRGGATRSTQPHPGAAHTQRGGGDGARARGAAVGPVGADALGEGRGNGSLRRVCRHHEHTFMPASQPSHVMRSACPAATLISAAGSPCCCRPSCPSPPLPHSPAPPPGSGGRR